jgi:asparagine synthase (glutamine-hydrolysing)
MDLEVNGGVEYMTSMWLEPVRRKMHALGIQVVLSGFMGDQVVSHSGRNHWADLADEGRLLRFLAACLKHGRPDILFGRTIKRILPESLADLLARMRTTAPPGHSWLRKGIALPDMPSAPTTPGRFRYKRHLLWSVNRPTVARRLQNEAICGIRHRIIPAYPMADLRLIEWVLSLPVSVIGHPNHDRFLFRSAMEGILPEPVRWRRDKDVPAGVYLLQENRRFHEQVRAWVMDLRKRPGDPLLDMVDFDRILEGLDPHRTENQWKGNFYPNMPFHLQALLRYAEKQAEK